MSGDPQTTGRHWTPPGTRPERTGRGAAAPGSDRWRRVAGLVLYGLLGVAFGALLTEAEIVSWFRIQEMFRFDSFHMYGIIGSAVAVAALSLRVLRWRRARAGTGAEIVVPPKTLGRGVRYVAGGLLFGVGWALTGACPGPLLALVGSGAAVFGVAILAALAGVWTYGHLRPRLPH